MTSGEPDRIELRGLVVRAHIGAEPEERSRRQPIEIDVDVYADLARSGGNDELGDTVDYGTLCASIDAVVKDEEFVLLERLATRITEVALSDLRVERVTVAVRKLHPPVAQQLATAGVRVSRGRTA